MDVVSKTTIVEQAQDLIGRENLVVGTPIYKQIETDFKRLKKLGKVSLSSSDESDEGEKIGEFGIIAPPEDVWDLPDSDDNIVYPKKWRGKYLQYDDDLGITTKYSIDKEGRGEYHPDFDYNTGGESNEKFTAIAKRKKEEEAAAKPRPKPVATSPKPRPKPPPKKDKTKPKDWWERTAKKYVEDSFEDNMKSSQGVTLQKAIIPKEYFSELKQETGREERGELSLIRGLGQKLKGWDDPELLKELESKGFIEGQSPDFSPSGMTERQAIAALHREKLTNIKSTDWYKREIQGFALPDFTEYSTPKSQPKPVATSPKPRPKKVGTSTLTQQELKEVDDLYPKTPLGTQPVLPGQVAPYSTLEQSLEFPAGSVGVLPADTSVDVGEEGFGELDEILGGGEYNVELDEFDD